MRRLAHISDLHFGKANSNVVRGLLADLERIKPDLIVVSGDLTERALHRQFVAARAFLDRLPAPWLAVQGNHDVPLYSLRERFTRPTARFERYIAADLEPVRHLEGVCVIGLNSAHGNTWKSGRLRDEAIARACDAASAKAADVNVVVAHHPFLAPPDTPDFRVVDNGAATLKRFADSGVALVLGGHVHRAYARDARTCFPDLSQSVFVVQAPTATSYHLRDQPNGYNLLSVDGSDIRLDVRYWRDGDFTCGRRRSLVTQPGPLSSERATSAIPH